jgi:arabinofuranan 3-O-arabinosyltransferase
MSSAGSEVNDGAMGGTPARTAPRILGIFANWRLLAYGYTIPVFYVAFFAYLYSHRMWLVNPDGMPVYHDFTNMFAAGSEALHGHAASVYDPVEHLKAQEQLVGTGRAVFSIWPYPPIYLLILAPLAVLPFLTAFFAFETATLLGLVALAHRIVRRPPAIALVLASPLTAWNFLMGQSGFLTAALLGASLLLLERRPVLASVFIGCLSYKPQFGLLFPIALVAANQWRAIAGAAATIVVLAAFSIAVFGTQPWVMFPQELSSQAGDNLFAVAPAALWGNLQTVYGLVRYFNGSAALAWMAQVVTALTAGAIVWVVWRSPTRYAPKAATLSAAVLVATPYAFAYDLAAIVIPVAFLASDQLRCGVLSGEQTTLLALFAAGLPIFWTAGSAPLGAAMMMTLLCLALRRGITQSLEAVYIAQTRPA